MDTIKLDKNDNDSGVSGLPSRASSALSSPEHNTSIRLTEGSENLKRSSDPSVQTNCLSQSRPESVTLYDSCAEIDVLFHSDKNLERVPSLEHHKRRGSGRRVRRCESARDGNEHAGKTRHKVRRSVSERGEDEDRPKRHRHHHHHNHRQGSKRSKATLSHSKQSLGSLADRISVQSNGKSFHRQRSLSESVAIELGLKETPEISFKESNRRRIVFAVVVISLAILTASVFLVAITLMLNPAVDGFLRKENEELHKVMGHHNSTPRPLESTNRTALSSASSALPDG